MKIYTVGGAVRDHLLGLPVKDRDHVVVGATVEDMLRDGFQQVGRDFPVFLHPQTHEEYALARTERKSARGYHGFVIHASPDVSLEDDLARRDLTINAIARDESTGTLIDPYHGVRDLRAGVLRHVGPAFIEDPVRILRLARFAARFGFVVAPETQQLLETMVASGEVDHLVPERVWQELSRGLVTARPDRMIDVLVGCGALAHLLPGAVDAGGRTAIAALMGAARREASLEERFAAWLGTIADVPQGTAVANHLRAPVACRELLVLGIRLKSQVLACTDAPAETLVRVLREADAWRRPERFGRLLAVCADLERALEPRDAAVATDQHASIGRHPWAERLTAALGAAGTVDTAAIARSRPADIAQAIEQARIQAVRPVCKT